MTDADSVVEQLCLNCAICCDGTLFGDVELPDGGDAERLRRLGLGLRRRGERLKLLQPCRALDGCRCRVYAERPTRCAEFECLLLRAVKQDGLSVTEAQKVIRSTRRRVGEIKNLLAKLGDERDAVPLGPRFRDVMNNEELRARPELAETLWKLGDRYHHLTLRLGGRFYPGE